MHQRAGLRHIIHVGRRAHDRVHQARVGVHADVRFHAEVPCMDAPGLPSFQFTTTRRYRLQPCIRTSVQARPAVPDGIRWLAPHH